MLMFRSNPHDPLNSPTPAVGSGPNAGGAFSQEDYHHPAAGWGAAMSVGLVVLRQHELIDGARVVFKMNHEERGFDCPGCAWPDDPHGLTMDICENGIKHATWELTRKRANPDFFAEHTVAELSGWSDFALEDAGRLTEPMRYDAGSDRYVPLTWDEAFALVGRHLRGLDSPDRAAFYTSGRLGNEATFLYQLWARELGTNNLPDCSNMCHEASGRALQAALGTGKGTVDLSYRALPYDLPRGSAMGYMPELNALCPIGDYSPQSDQPLMKHLVVEITPSRAAISSREDA
jgi:hypothetical protein